jgi:sugar phosphate permease
MLSSGLAAYLERRNIHYGWAVVAVTFLTMLVSAGVVGTPGVFIPPLQKEFGWGTDQISLAIAIRNALFGLMAPFAAGLMNKYGVRRMVVIAFAVNLTGLLLSLGMTQLWQLILLWGVVLGIGTGLTAAVLGATVATRWFTKRRGLVLGILTASMATGQLVFMRPLAMVTDAVGWRYAIAVICVALVIAILAFFAFMRNRPSDVGLLPFGETAESAAAAAVVAGPVPSATSSLRALADASRSPTFWVLFGTFFVCGTSTNGLVQTHFISLCGDYGIAAVTAAGILAMMGICDFIGTVGSGWLSDRYDSRWLLFWYYGLRGLSLLYLPFTGFTFYGLSLFGVFYGLDWIATVPPTVKLAADRFGRERAGVVFGWVFTGHQLGAALAAYGAGFSRAAFSSYLPAFVTAGALCIIASGAILTLSRPQKAGLPPAMPKPAEA